MCFDCNDLGYREVQLEDGILRDYCECDVGQDLKEIVASEDFEYHDEMFTSVDGTVIDVVPTRIARACIIVLMLLVVILVSLLIWG